MISAMTARQVEGEAEQSAYTGRRVAGAPLAAGNDISLQCAARGLRCACYDLTVGRHIFCPYLLLHPLC
jgi:hypothetical protein